MERICKSNTDEAVETSLRQLSGDVVSLLKLARQATGWSMEFWSELTEGMEPHAVALLVLRAEMLADKVKDQGARDAQLGGYIRSICQGELEQDCTLFDSEEADFGAEPGPHLLPVQKPGEILSVEKALKSFEVIYPQSVEAEAERCNFGCCAALDPEGRELVSGLLRRLTA